MTFSSGHSVSLKGVTPVAVRVWLAWETGSGHYNYMMSSGSTDNPVVSCMLGHERGAIAHVAVRAMAAPGDPARSVNTVLGWHSWRLECGQRGARGPSKHVNTNDVRPTEVALHECVTTVTVRGLTGLADRVKRLELYDKQQHTGY